MLHKAQEESIAQYRHWNENEVSASLRKAQVILLQNTPVNVLQQKIDICIFSITIELEEFAASIYTVTFLSILTLDCNEDSSAPFYDHGVDTTD